MASTHAPLVAQLQRQLDDALGPLLAGAPAVALLDFPDYANMGDSAIWLGTVATLERLGAPVPTYTCDAVTYDRDTLARHVGDGVILLNGGGNFGDLWPRHQLFRERVIADFPKNPIVALSQSMHFVDREALERARTVLGAHERLTLLLRDRESHEEATRLFGAAARLAPDMVFGLPPLERPGAPEHDVLWLKRDDQEGLWPASDVSGLGSAVTDWAGAEDTSLVRLHDELVRSTTNPAVAADARSALTGLHPRLAQERIDRGVLLLSSARVVVTDRLHGHIFALLLGIPHVVLDNSYGKISRFMSAWTGASPLVHRASSPAEAAELARALLTEGT
jgi:pyruvyl transferase EpsO